MKRLSVVCVMLGLSVVPACAEDFLTKLFGSGAPPQQQGRSARRASDRHAHANNVAAQPMPEGARGFVANASYYGGGPRKYEPNAHTASGEHFNQWGLTAAHRTLPLGTRLRVTHGGHSVVVRVNDRGPAAWTGRSLDLSRGAASVLGLISSGTGAVRVQVLGRS